MATEIRKITKLSWHRFLQTPEGIEGMLFLREHAPSIAKGDSDGIIFDAGRTEGYKNCLDTISEIIAAEPIKTEDLENR